MAAPVTELEFRRFLVAIDGSPSAELALSAALTAARRVNASIALICVAPDVVAGASRWPGPAPLPVDQTQADEFAGRILRDAVDRLPEDIPITTIMRRGKPGHEIVAAADESNYDAILLGARGLGRLESMVGSVSQYVMHHAKVAVFVVHAPPGDDA
jgi:nucleotide-binding universal stress UspA family protein